MDFMFEDEVDEVGSDVEAYCPKCKADTTHVVISKYEDEIRRVQCNPCGDVHSFRKPRGEVEDDVPEPIAAKKRAMMKKPNWDEFFAKHGEKQGKPYEFRERYSENVIVTHPKFGRGFVSEVMSDSKVEITFKDARRVLVHNRKDMPGLPLAAEGDGIPSKGPKAKAVKTKAAMEEREAAKAAAALPKVDKTAGKLDATSKKATAKPAVVASPAQATKAGKPDSGKPDSGKPDSRTAQKVKVENAKVVKPQAKGKVDAVKAAPAKKMTAPPPKPVKAAAKPAPKASAVMGKGKGKGTSAPKASAAKAKKPAVAATKAKKSR